MSVVAAAIITTTAVSAYTADQSAKAQSEAAEKGSQLASDTTIASTQAQLEEIRYQFDYTQAAMAEGRQLEYNAQNAFGTMLGINGPNTSAGTPGAGAGAGAGQGGQPAATGEYQQGEAYLGHQAEIDRIQGELDSGWVGTGDDYQSGRRAERRENAWIAEREAEISGLQGQQQELKVQEANEQLGTGNYMVDREGNIQGFGANQQFEPTVDERGFYDPMADPTQMAAPSLQEDLVYQNVMGNQLAGPGYEDDPYFQRVTDTAYTPESLTTSEFEQSPGYQFAVDEGMNAMEKRNSAGGNFGGRAIKEAMRYGTGMANQEYYNWAALRGTDLSRQDTAERYNRGREDSAQQNYLSRRGTDVARGDSAVQSYLGRQEYDIGRNDMNRNNYMNRMGATAGLGGNISSTVSAAQAQGQGTAAAFRSEGNALSSIYQNQGNTNANIQGDRYANMNNAVQSGVGNYLTYQGLQDRPQWDDNYGYGSGTGSGQYYANYA